MCVGGFMSVAGDGWIGSWIDSCGGPAPGRTIMVNSIDEHYTRKPGNM